MRESKVAMGKKVTEKPAQGSSSALKTKPERVASQSPSAFSKPGSIIDNSPYNFATYFPFCCEENGVTREINVHSITTADYKIVSKGDLVCCRSSGASLSEMLKSQDGYIAEPRKLTFTFIKPFLILKIIFQHRFYSCGLT